MSDSDRPAPTCEYVKDDGERCKVNGGLEEYEGELRCLFHDPNRREKARRARERGARTKNARKKGGKNIRVVDPDSAPPPPETVHDAVRWASWAVWAVTTGEIDGRTAHEIGYLLNAFQRAIEKVDFADRVEELEEKLEALENRERMEAVR